MCIGNWDVKLFEDGFLVDVFILILLRENFFLFFIEINLFIFILKFIFLFFFNVMNLFVGFWKEIFVCFVLIIEFGGNNLFEIFLFVLI